MSIGGRWLGNSAKLALLSAVAIAGFAAWFLLPEPSGADHDTAAPRAIEAPVQGSAADNTTVGVAPQQEASAATAVSPEVAEAAPVAPAGPEAAAPERSPLEGLKIASQRWRRGGLGSKALVTLTVRNRNDFAVKDIEIACAFARRDGSHVTDRKRVIGDTIEMKSRKTYPGVLVGFVNVNAQRAKCSLVTASRL